MTRRSNSIFLAVQIYYHSKRIVISPSMPAVIHCRACPVLATVHKRCLLSHGHEHEGPPRRGPALSKTRSGATTGDPDFKTTIIGARPTPQQRSSPSPTRHDAFWPGLGIHL
ncbi:hypothetical protein MCOR27_006779 [Pyricularia oryzae]|uniref:Uncharacterized protein n=1 Tax=Pyricularia grisea TaxID=148305 RepID=A0ABQ8NQX2_PYRGI|nr:hypothetical protein MCOR01_010792 [Pyricularia oryzae]KAI6300824.1 hypothetical protein MCOR33_003568 [Pyricularia grisea]KAH9438187.1 hypothetical protein MCOR02_001825 [Pyricularia oryzae]KAI6263667.1 hypothetical protein MCOR19_000001 [Pyricularia oryzae]KAI6275829.1 hypothetical protein MCOR27_006779 [Pyricularia oryzae]